MRRIQNTIALARASWDVLRADKELLVLPVMSMVATAIVGLSFVVPGFLVMGNGRGPVGYVLMFLGYLAAAYVTIFFNSALVHAANMRLEGNDPTLGTALAGAWSRRMRILPWAILSATVSLIIRSLEERAGILGRLVAGIAGLAWSLVTFLVLPILVVEGISLSSALRRSSQLFRQTWGENVAAQVGFGLLGFLLTLPGILVVAGAATLGTTAAIVGIVVAVLWFVVVAVVVAALNGIFQTALYRFAREGYPGHGFPPDALGSAFSPR